MSSTRSRPSSARSQSGAGSPGGDRLAPPKPPAISVPFTVPTLPSSTDPSAVKKGEEETRSLRVRVPGKKCASGREAVGSPQASGTPRAAGTPRGALSPVTSPTSFLHPALMGVAKVVDHMELPSSPGIHSARKAGAATQAGGGHASHSDNLSAKASQSAKSWAGPQRHDNTLQASLATPEQAKRAHVGQAGVDPATPSGSQSRPVPRPRTEPRPSPSHRGLHRTASSSTLGTGMAFTSQGPAVGVVANRSPDVARISSRRLRSASLAAAEFARSTQVAAPNLSQEGSLLALTRQLSTPGPQALGEGDADDEREGVRDVYVPTWRTFWPVATAADTGPPRHRSLYWQDFEWPSQGARGSGRDCPHVAGRLGTVRKACELCLPSRDVARVDHMQAYGHLRLICRDRISGVPVRGAAVRVDAGTGRNAGSTCGMASVTDVTGEVTVSVLAGRLYQLSASCTGYYPYGRFGESLSVFVEDGALYTVHVLMVPVRIGAILTLWEITPLEDGDRAEGAHPQRTEWGTMDFAQRGWVDKNNMVGHDGFQGVDGRFGGDAIGVAEPALSGGDSRGTMLGWQPGQPTQERIVILLEPGDDAGGSNNNPGGGGSSNSWGGGAGGGMRQHKRAVFRARCMRNHANAVAVWAEDTGADASNDRGHNGTGNSVSNGWFDAGKSGTWAGSNVDDHGSRGGGKQGVVASAPQLAATPSQLSLCPLRRVCLCDTNEDGRVFFSGGQAEEETVAQQRALEAFQRRQAAAAAAAAEPPLHHRRLSGEANAPNSAATLTPATVALLERSSALEGVDTFDANAAVAAGHAGAGHATGGVGRALDGEAGVGAVMSGMNGDPIFNDPDAAHVLEYLAHVQVLPPGAYLAALGDPSLSLQFASRNTRERMEGMDLSRSSGRIPFSLVAPKPRVVTSRSNRFEYDADSLLVEDIYTDNTAHAFVGCGRGHGQYLPWDLFVRRRPRLRVQLVEIGQGGSDVLPWGEPGRFLSVECCRGFRYSFVRGSRVRTRKGEGTRGEMGGRGRRSPTRAQGKASRGGKASQQGGSPSATSPRDARGTNGHEGAQPVPRARTFVQWEDVPLQEGPVDNEGSLDGLWMDPGYVYRLTVVASQPFVEWHVHVVVAPTRWTDVEAFLSFARRVPIKFTVYDVQTDEPVANARINVTVTVPPPPPHAGWVVRPQDGDGSQYNANVTSPLQRGERSVGPFSDVGSPRPDPFSQSPQRWEYGGQSPMPTAVTASGSSWVDGFWPASPTFRGDNWQTGTGAGRGMGLMLEEAAARSDASITAGRLDTLVGAWLDGVVREIASEAVTEAHVLYTDETGVAEVLVPPLSHVTGVLRVGPPYMVEGNDYSVRQRVGLKRETIHFRLQRVSKVIALCCDAQCAADASSAATSPALVGRGRGRDPRGSLSRKGVHTGDVASSEPRGQQAAARMPEQQPATIAGCSVVVSLAETFSGETLKPTLELVRGVTRANGLLPPMVVRAGTVLAIDVRNFPVEYCTSIEGIVEAEEAHVNHHKSKLQLLSPTTERGADVPVRDAASGAVSPGQLARRDGGASSPAANGVGSPGVFTKGFAAAGSREPVGRLVATTRDVVEGPFYLPRHAPLPYAGVPPSLLPSSPEPLLLRRVLYEREVLRLLFRHKPWLYVHVFDAVSGEEVHTIDYEVWLRMDWLDEDGHMAEARADLAHPGGGDGALGIGLNGLVGGGHASGPVVVNGSETGGGDGDVARYIPVDEVAQAAHADIIKHMYGGLATHAKRPDGEFDPTRPTKKKGRLKGVFYTSSAWEEEDEIETTVDGVYFRERRVLRSLDTRVLDRNTLWFAPGANLRVTLKPDFPYVTKTVSKTLTVREVVDCEVVELFLERDPDAAWFWLQHEGRMLPWSLLASEGEEVLDKQLTARALAAQRKEAKKRALLMESVRRLVDGHHRMPRLKDVLLKWGAFVHVGGCERVGDPAVAGEHDDEHAVYCNVSFFTWRCKDNSIVHVGFLPHMVASLAGLVEEYRESLRGLELHLAYVQAKVVERPPNGRFFFGTAALHFNGCCVFAVDCSSAISPGLLKIVGEEVEQLISFWAARVQGSDALAAKGKAGATPVKFYVTPRFSLLGYNSGGIKRWRNGDFITSSAAAAGEARVWVESLKPGGVTDVAGGMEAVLNTLPPVGNQAVSAATSNIHSMGVRGGGEGGGSGPGTPRGSSSSKIDAVFLITSGVDVHSHESVLIRVGKQLRENRCHVHGTHLLLDNEDGATAALLGLPGGTPAAELWERGEELLHRITALTGGRYHFVDCAHGLVEAMAVPKPRVLAAMAVCRAEMEHLTLFMDAYKQELRRADLLRGTKLSLRGTFASHYHTDNIHCDPRSLGSPKPQLHPNISPAMLAHATLAPNVADAGTPAGASRRERGESPSKGGSPSKHGASPSKARGKTSLAASLNLSEDVLARLERIAVPGAVLLQDREESLKWALERAFQEPTGPPMVAGDRDNLLAHEPRESWKSTFSLRSAPGKGSQQGSLGPQPSTARLGTPVVKSGRLSQRPATASAARPTSAPRPRQEGPAGASGSR